MVTPVPGAWHLVTMIGDETSPVTMRSHSFVVNHAVAAVVAGLLEGERGEKTSTIKKAPTIRNPWIEQIYLFIHPVNGFWRTLGWPRRSVVIIMRSYNFTDLSGS